MSNRRHEWSELQAELLVLILEKLDLADHARFASVCSSWRSVAVKNPPINKPLYLALSHDPSNLIRRFISSFIPFWEEAMFIGALEAWLVLLIDRKDLFLLNKGSNSIIPLPPPPMLPPPSNRKNLTGRRLIYCKAVLSAPPLSSSSGECNVVLKTDRLYYCRLGSDNSFSKLLEDKPHRVRDLQFYKGRLYVLYHYTDIIVIFDHLLNKVAQLVAHFGNAPHRHSGPYRFLISEDKLLIAVGCLDPLWVFEFEQDESRVVRVEHMNDNLLLLINSLCSLSITTKEHKEFQRTPKFCKFRFRSTLVLGTSEDSTKPKVDDPRPLFFVMFINNAIKSWGVGQPIMLFGDECS